MSQALKRKSVGRRSGAYAQSLRVLDLYERLLRGGDVSIGWARDHFSVSARQVQRDVAVVRERLILEKRADGAWYLPRGRKSAQESRVRRAEVLSVLLGAKLSEWLWATPRATQVATAINALVRDLGRADGERLVGWLHRVAVVAPGQKDYAHRPEVALRLEQMLDAMVEHRPVELSYLSVQRALDVAAPRRMLVHPLGIVFYRDGVYFVVDVVGEELGGKRILLALDRMDQLALGEAGGFRVPKDFDFRVFLGDAFGIWAEGANHDVTIEVDRAHAPYLLERNIHHTQRVEQRTDGSVLLRMRLDGLREVEEWILSLGEHAEVVEPPELRARIGGRLGEASARYDEGGDILCRDPASGLAQDPRPRSRP